MSIKVENMPTNSPLREVPDDYIPVDKPSWYVLQSGKDAGKLIYYADFLTKPGEKPEATVLFVHGNPENSYTWRHARDSLIASGRPLRIIVMDHVGFGLSDQADFEMIDMHHAENLAQLVRYLDLHDVTLVVHDWGGPIGFGAFLDMPERISGIVVANSTLFPMPKTGLTYMSFPTPLFPWVAVGYIMPQRLWGGVAAAVVRPMSRMPFFRFTLILIREMIAYLTRQHTPDSAAYVFSQQYRTKANVMGGHRHIKHTATWGYGYRYTDKVHGVQDNHHFYDRLQNELVPYLKSVRAGGVFGTWDPCGKPEVVAQWCDAFPAMSSNLVVIENGGHFIEESDGDKIADVILALRDKA